MRTFRGGRLAPVGLLFVLAAFMCAGTADAAAFTRRPHVNSVNETSAVIVFQTDTSCAVTVRYGQGAELSQSASGASGKNHSIRLSGLTPGAQHSYQVEACGAVLGDTDTFQTASTARTSKVHFLALGDMGTGGSMQTKVAAAMHKAQGEFWLALGDIAYGSGTASEFTSNFFKPMAELLEDIPTFPTSGNHEYYTDQAQPYLDAFTLPTNNPQGSERYYSFDWGPVHVVSIDTECAADYDTGSCDGAAQSAWLRADLAASTRPWKVAILHRPLWSSGEHGSNTKVRSVIGPILEEYGVDLVLTGHDHDYERSKPMRGNNVDEQNGIPYIVMGSGGATLRPFAGSTPAWTAYRNDTDYGFLDVVIDGGTLTAKFLTHDGQVKDTLTLTKQVTAPAEPTLTVVAEPASGTVPLQTTLNAESNLADAQFAWTLPGGGTATGPQVNLELTTPGAHTATVTATGEGISITQSVTVAANEADCSATNSCFQPDSGQPIVRDAGTPGPGGDDGEEPPPGGCSGGSAALLIPFGVIGMMLRRRRQ